MNILWQNAFWIINKDLAKDIWIEGALLLSDLIDKNDYFSNRWEITEDWFFYNTIENIEKDTTLTRKLQDKNIKILKDYWYIETRVSWMPAKRFFKINTNKILLFIQSSLYEKDKLDCIKKTTNNNKEIIIKNNNKINNQKSEDFWDFNFSQDFKDVFFLYEKHRKEKKSKLTETARKLLLKKSSAVGEKIAIEKIQESIQNWRTWVFFDKEQKQKNKPKLACEDKTKDFNFLD